MVSENATEIIDGIKEYELTIIVNPQVEEEPLNNIVDTITRYITEHKGTVSKVEPWGKRKLAYPIKHVLEGLYVLIEYTGKPSINKELKTNMEISEDIIRYLIILKAS